MAAYKLRMSETKPAPDPQTRDPLDLIDLLALERIEVNLFRGHGPKDNGEHFFGGHVIAQALLAAYETVPDRICHSLHAYFIRPGNVHIPVLYEVDRARDGGSFTTRRVIAIQNGEQIFNLAASFQVARQGFDHQSRMPNVLGPEHLLDQAARAEQMEGKVPEQAPERQRRPRPIEMLWVQGRPSAADQPREPQKQVWMRAKASIRPDLHLHQALLAYASDMTFMETALRPHGLSFQTPGLQYASLDHAMWFHRPFDFNQWMLFAQDSPSASQGRGLVRGEMFTHDGQLAASVVQECLMHLRPPKA